MQERGKPAENCPSRAQEHQTSLELLVGLSQPDEDVSYML